MYPKNLPFACFSACLCTTWGNISTGKASGQKQPEAFFFKTYAKGRRKKLCSPFTPHLQIERNSPAFFNTGLTAIYTAITTRVPATALVKVTPAAQVDMILAASD